jgi:hypothetical protein
MWVCVCARERERDCIPSIILSDNQFIIVSIPDANTVRDIVIADRTEIYFDFINVLILLMFLNF